MASDTKDPTGEERVRRSYEQKGTFKTAKNIVKHRGITGLYSGFHLHLRKFHACSEMTVYLRLLVRDTIGTSVYFMTYESVKQLLATYQGSSSPTAPGPVAFAGGLCGLLSWISVSRVS